MMGYLGELFFIFLGACVALGVLGWLLSRRDKKRGTAPGADTALPEETLENVAALNDQFDRARYMDRDGK